MPTANVAAFCIVLFALASWKYHVLETEMKEVYQRAIDEVVQDYDQRLKEQNRTHNEQVRYLLDLNRVYERTNDELVQDYDQRIKEQNKMHTMQMGNLTKYNELLAAQAEEHEKQIEDYEKQIASLKKGAEEVSISRSALGPSLVKNSKHHLDEEQRSVQQYVGHAIQWALRKLVFAFVGIFVINVIFSSVHSCTKCIRQKRT